MKPPQVDESKPEEKTSATSGYERIKGYVSLTRPGTLVAPAAAGFLLPLAALAHFDRLGEFWAYAPWIASSMFVLAGCNLASNIGNQISDTVEDAISHPNRPIVSGAVDRESAIGVMGIAYGIALVLGFTISYTYGLLVALILLCAWLYSFQPFRLKKILHLNQIAIASPRGGLGVLAAWSVIASPLDPFILFFALAVAVFVFGANSTKDFSDAEGDKKAGVRNWVTIYGEKQTCYLITVFSWLSVIILFAGELYGVYPISIFDLVGMSFIIVCLFTILINGKIKARTKWGLFYALLASYFIIFTLYCFLA